MGCKWMILIELLAATNEGVREIPDDAHKGFKHIKYGKWFQVPQDAKAENVKYKSLTCLNTLFSVSHVRTVFKFRLGMSRLNCEDLRSTHSARLYKTLYKM